MSPLLLAIVRQDVELVKLMAAKGADLTFRFPRSWLAQWRDVANAMSRLTTQMHGAKG